MARYLVDECLGQLVVSNLRKIGRDVAWVRDGSEGLSDEDVLAWSVRDQRVLLTEDYDYGELIFGRGRSAYGVVILQLSEFEGTWSEVAGELTNRIVTSEEKFRGFLTTLGNDRVKSRPFPAVSIGGDLES